MKYNSLILFRREIRLKILHIGGSCQCFSEITTAMVALCKEMIIAA